MNVSAASAVTLLSRAQSFAAAKQKDDASSLDIVATANGLAPQENEQPKTRYEMAKASEAMFSVNAEPNITELKLNLFDRIGKVFGLKREDYQSISVFGLEVKRALGNLMQNPDADERIRKIEKELGLDKLGIRLTEVIEAMIDPIGQDAKELHEALKRKADEEAKGDAPLDVALDELGLYRATK